MDAGDHEPSRRKRPRKSRGRGLRTNTGCLTCRKRHKKCDENRPVCGPCGVSSRSCLFPQSIDVQADLEAPYRGETSELGSANGRAVRREEPLPESEQSVSQSPSLGSHRASVVQPALGEFGGSQHASQHDLQLHAQASPKGIAFLDTLPMGCSPDTVASELWTADLASTRWLGLLANDAAQADSGFSLAPSPASEDGLHRPKLPRAAAVHASPALLNGQAQLPDFSDPELERRAWQAEWDVALTDHEAVLFRHFAERCARWLDLFDTHRLFSTYATRLALRNTGLMKAILALSAKHRSRLHGAAVDIVGHGESGEWIRYYYETLHYVQEALAYPSYTHSEELLATAIVISAYEMLDESDGSGNWQRHLKGVFWIQRSQDVDGGCGGIRQAVWWSWLRQDIWAAFREKRRCFSFWKPMTELHELSQYDLADRAIYLLSQAVNYAADSRTLEAASATDPAAGLKRGGVRDELLSQMQHLRSFLGDGYKPLPVPSSPADIFTPLWIHPPQFGVALQACSFAQILVTLHSPNLVGFNGYVKMQRTLSEAVDTICGIALELRDEGCQILSAQCLYGAGLCVDDGTKRQKIMSLIEDCEARVGWAPMATWRDDLRREWAKADNESPD